MGDEATNQLLSNSSISWPKAILSFIDKLALTEEQGLSIKLKFSHPVARRTSEMFLLSSPFYFR